MSLGKENTYCLYSEAFLGVLIRGKTGISLQDIVLQSEMAEEVGVEPIFPTVFESITYEAGSAR